MIDIVIATYNPNHYILEQIKSILSQSAIDKISRIIISDDNSDDDFYLKQILEADPRIELHKNRSGKRGAKYNFSYGLSITSAPFIMTCDQDDVWLDNKVEISLDKILSLDNELPCLVATDVTIVDADLEVIHNSFLNYRSVSLPDDMKCECLLYRNIFPGCSMIFNRRLLLISLPIPDNAMMHDWWLISVAALVGRVAYCSKSTMLYRQHDNNCVGAMQNSIFRAFFSRTISANLTLLQHHVDIVRAQNKLLYNMFVSNNFSVLSERNKNELYKFVNHIGFYNDLLVVYRGLRLGLVKTILYAMLKLIGKV